MMYTQDKQNLEVEVAITPFREESYIIPYFESISKKTFHTGRNKVNLHYLSCSCKKYREKVKIYPKRALGRLCNHLYQIISIEGEQSFDQLTRALIDAKFWFGQHNLYFLQGEGIDYYIGFNKTFDRSIIHFYHESWERYIYNITEQKWINEIEPMYSSYLIAMIHELKENEFNKSI